MGQATSAKSNKYHEAARAVSDAATGDEAAVDRLAGALREAVEESITEALGPVNERLDRMVERMNKSDAAINKILEAYEKHDGAIKVLDDRLAEVPSKQQIDTLLEKMDRDNEASKERDKKIDEILLMLHRGETSGPVQ